MSRHSLDREFALPTTQECLQRQRAEAQAALIAGDSTYRPLQLVSGYSPRLFVGDADFGQPELADEDERLALPVVRRHEINRG